MDRVVRNTNFFLELHKIPINEKLYPYTAFLESFFSRLLVYLKKKLFRHLQLHNLNWFEDRKAIIYI